MTEAPLNIGCCRDCYGSFHDIGSAFLIVVIDPSRRLASSAHPLVRFPAAHWRDVLLGILWELMLQPFITDSSTDELLPLSTF